jgi:fused signal recognition particle receptor
MNELFAALAEYWGPILGNANEFFAASPLPNPLISIPLLIVIDLLLMFLLERRVNARRFGATDDEPVDTIETESIEDVEIATEPPESLSLDEEPEVDFMFEEEDLEAGEETPIEPLPEAMTEAAEEPTGFEALEEPVVEEEPEPEPEPEPVEEEPKLSWLGRLRQGLSKTKDGFVSKIDALLTGRTKIDDDLFENLEEILVTGDIGISTAYKLLEAVQAKVDDEKLEDPSLIREILKDKVKEILNIENNPIDPSVASPYVMMVVGVNGTGKTTTIGKIASRLTSEGHKVLLAAADTFRAAAIEQLEVWANRSGVEIIKQKEGADPSAVAFDAIDAAIARKADVVIIDTAGRLHTKQNLMQELGKIKRVIQKKLPDAPHETLLVLDATTGQNAIIQAKEFNKATELSGMILTKLDGTAKGGCIVGIADEFKLPIRFIGIGEKIDDLRPFDAEDFVEALF